jgi:3-deoxy-D-manno-octulosonic-acid transferase
MLILFQVVFLISSVLLSPWYLAKMLRRGGAAHRFGERFGIYPSAARRRAAGKKHIWIQACSIGEMRVALALIGHLRKLRPDLPVALTTTTTTGMALAQKSAPPDVMVLYFPVDFYPCALRALRLLQPQILLIVETDVWPTLVLTARRSGIPVGIVNGRMSEKSFRGYRRLGFISRAIYREFNLVCAQGPMDAQRYARLGVRAAAVRITGSLKFDEAQNAGANPGEARRFLAACGADSARPVWVCGSTFPGEEEIVFRTLHKLRGAFPALFLVVAPRHPERAPKVMSIARRCGINLALRTEAPQSGVDGILLNSAGELKSFYGLATVIFVGKSLRGRGGQNLIEAAATGAPVLFGPAMQNFEAAAEKFIQAGGAIQVRDENEMEARLHELLASPDRRNQIAERARDVIQTSSGATARTCSAILEILAQAAACGR